MLYSVYMNTKQYNTLITKAKQIMSKSLDPIHDLSHVERVVKTTKKMCHEMQLKEADRQILTLAAWWHDTSRTKTRKPSILLMPFLDDAFSALLLWFYACRNGIFFHPVVRVAIRIIFCKTIGTGKYLTRTILQKQHRHLVDILKDADTLDVLHVERAKQACLLAEQSTMYYFGYKMLVWWHLSTKALELRTSVAKKYLTQILKDFMLWVKQDHILEWHTKQYGTAWLEKQLKKCERYINALEYSSHQVCP